MYTTMCNVFFMYTLHHHKSGYALHYFDMTVAKVVVIIINDPSFLENGESMHNALKEHSGQRTVPNVYIHGSHVGGADDTKRVSQLFMYRWRNCYIVT